MKLFWWHGSMLNSQQWPSCEGVAERDRKGRSVREGDRRERNQKQVKSWLNTHTHTQTNIHWEGEKAQGQHHGNEKQYCGNAYPHSWQSNGPRSRQPSVTKVPKLFASKCKIFQCFSPPGPFVSCREWENKGLFCKERENILTQDTGGCVYALKFPHNHRK